MTGCRVKQRNCQIQTYLLPQSSQQDFVRYRLHSVCANTRMHAVLICRIYFVRLKRRKFLWVAGWSSGTLSYYHLQTFVEQVSLSLLNFLSFCLSLSASFSRSLLPLIIYFFLSFLSIYPSTSLSKSLFPFLSVFEFRICVHIHVVPPIMRKTTRNKVIFLPVENIWIPIGGRSENLYDKTRTLWR